MKQKHIRDTHKSQIITHKGTTLRVAPTLQINAIVRLQGKQLQHVQQQVSTHGHSHAQRKRRSCFNVLKSHRRKRRKQRPLMSSCSMLSRNLFFIAQRPDCSKVNTIPRGCQEHSLAYHVQTFTLSAEFCCPKEIRMLDL